jgi:tRNA dimethylallyltransferase
MHRVLAILGPTAVGKSWLGLLLGETLPGEIISADALQAYRGFDIGTAKPSAAECLRVPHHLIDIRDPDEPYSAGEFSRLASGKLEEIRQRQRRPLVVGGSGLYVRALLDGISPIPATSREIREELGRELADCGLSSLFRRLEKVDPATASRLSRGDTQRVMRALEVVLSTGRPLSSWLADNPTGPGGLESVRLGLTLPRDVLYDRISERVGAMIGAGWVEEVEGLLNEGYGPGIPAFQAIGYRQLAEHIAGKISLEEAIAKIVRATCRYAKRQMTWFRREEAIFWFSMEDSRQCYLEVSHFLRELGIGGNNDQG